MKNSSSRKNGRGGDSDKVQGNGSGNLKLMDGMRLTLGCQAMEGERNGKGGNGKKSTLKGDIAQCMFWFVEG